MRSTSPRRAAAVALVALLALAGCQFSGATGRVVQDDGTCTEIELPAVEVSAPTVQTQLPGPILRPCPTTTPPTTVPPTTPPAATTTPPATTTAPPRTTTPPPPTSTPPPPAPGIQPVVTRDGRTLEIGGERWKFAGLNADTWLGCWDGENGRTTIGALDRFFGELHDSSLTRVWVYRSDPNSVATLRRIVAAAEQHDQYLMVTLSDGNDAGTQCGSLKGSGYPADGGPVLAHARALVPQFAASPAVAFWEIINEGTTNASAAPWYATIGRELGRLDPNTLVVGGAGTCWNGTPIAACQAVNDPAWNDMVNMHEYDWSDGRVSHHAQNTEALAASLGLPWFSGESGFCCNGGPSGLSETGAADLLAREWTAYLNAPGSAGMLYWDFKWAYNSPSTINLGDRAWGTARTFTHPWQ